MKPHLMTYLSFLTDEYKD